MDRRNPNTPGQSASAAPDPARRKLVLTLLALPLTACQPTPTQPPARQRPTYTHITPKQSSSQEKTSDQITNTDPCASRLHDLCAPLLLYYATRQELPEQLEDLRRIPGYESAQFTCPVSNQPYIYNPVGVQTVGQPARIVLYDPAPSHSGFRWAIAIIEPPRPTDPLITKVIGLPESHFSLRIPPKE